MTGSAGSAGVFTTDRALIVRSWDAWLSSATEIAEADALGRPLGELFPELAERGMLARLERVAETAVVEVLAAAFHAYLLPCPPREPTPNFARMQQHVTIAPLRSGVQVVGVTVTIGDVTARLDRERQLAAQLASADEGARLQAVRALGAEDGQAIPLGGALGDSSWRVRRAAADGLARARDDEAAATLLAAVRERHRDPAVLNAALSALMRTEHDVVPPLVELLAAADSDGDVRTYVALALGLIEDRRAVPALVVALDDADANVRFHAIEALGRIGSRATTEPLTAVAESRDFSVAFAALDALALIGEPSVAPRLVPLLDDALLQTAAADALGRLGGADVAGPLAQLLAVPNAPVAETAAALAALHERLDDARGEGQVIANLVRAVITPESARRLVTALASVRPGERRGLVTVVGWLEADGVDEALAGALADGSVRRQVGDVLARRAPRSVAPLLAALADEDDEVRKAAAAALGRTGATRAVPALIDLLEEPPEVAVVAAGALARIGDDRAFEPLMRKLDAPQAAVRQAAVVALNAIGHADMATYVCGLLDAPSPRVREAAAKIAGYLGYAACVEAMLAHRHDPDDTVRRTVVEQLAHIDSPRAVAAVVEAAGAETPGVRAAAARALAYVSATDALPHLRAAFEDADPWVRYYAARSAGHQQIRELVPSLIVLATTGDAPPVRIAAVEALAQIGDQAGLSALLPVATDVDAAIAGPALLALGRSTDIAALDALRVALADTEPARRVAALAALGQRRDPSTVPTIAAIAAADADQSVRDRALAALVEISDRDAVAGLIGLTAIPRRRPAAIAALARLGAPDVDALVAGLSHPDIDVRLSVIEALGRMRQGAGTAALTRALRDPSSFVQAAAAHALASVELHREG